MIMIMIIIMIMIMIAKWRGVGKGVNIQFLLISLHLCVNFQLHLPVQLPCYDFWDVTQTI
jgi:hypothetical protein